MVIKDNYGNRVGCIEGGGAKIQMCAAEFMLLGTI